MNGRKAVITHAYRTPLGALGKGFSSIGAIDLGVALIQGLLKKAGLKPDVVGRVWFGQARPDPEHPNIGGILAYKSGIPMESPAGTINQGAASGLQAIQIATQAVISGEVEVALAGALDTPSNLSSLADGDRESISKPGGLWCALLREPCGMAAEHLAARFEVSPKAMKEYAEESRAKAREAMNLGRLKDQIIPVSLPGEGGLMEKDDYLVEAMADDDSFPFKSEDARVPASTVASLADGAAAVLIMSADEAARRELKPLARIGLIRTTGKDPRFAGSAGINAAESVCGLTGIRPTSFDLVEIGETFAVDAIVGVREMGLDPKAVNPVGGDLALGHAFGASSARMVVSLVHEMVRQEARKGLITVSTCGGIGMAAAFFGVFQKESTLFSFPYIEEEAPPRSPVRRVREPRRL